MQLGNIRAEPDNENEFTALAPVRLTDDVSSHLTDNPPTDVQSQSNTLSVDLFGLIDKTVQTEQFALILLLDAAAVIVDADQKHVVASETVSQVRVDLPVTF